MNRYDRQNKINVGTRVILTKLQPWWTPKNNNDYKVLIEKKVHPFSPPAGTMGVIEAKSNLKKYPNIPIWHVRFGGYGSFNTSMDCLEVVP